MSDQKPMRGCTSPLIYYDDFDLFSEEHRKELESTEGRIFGMGSISPMSFNDEENTMPTNDREAGLTRDLPQDVLDAIYTTEPGPGSEDAERRLNDKPE